MRVFTLFVALLATLLSGLPARGAVPSGQKPLVVYAATDIAAVVTAVGEAFTAESGTPVSVSSGGSPGLARRLLEGEPADLFIPAETGVLQKLQKAGLVDGASSWTWATNSLVVAALPAATSVPAKPEEIADPRYHAIALPDPELAPMGMHARESFLYFHIWEAVRGRLLPTSDAGAALEALLGGKADLAIVYGSDARRDPRVKVVLELPAASHRVIEYPVALVAHPDASPAVRPFLQFLKSETAGKILVKGGFAPAFQR
jgi:molybdate transport system substrate-binding protein